MIERLRPRTMQIDRFTTHTGISRSTTYKLHKEEKLKFVKIGRRSLVDMDSYEALIGTAAASEAKPVQPARRHLRRASDPAPDTA